MWIVFHVKNELRRIEVNNSFCLIIKILKLTTDGNKTKNKQFLYKETIKSTLYLNSYIYPYQKILTFEITIQNKKTI